MHFLSSLLAICFIAHQGWACHCPGNHIQNVMCSDRHTAVFKGRVQSSGGTPEVGYTNNQIQVEEVFDDFSNRLNTGNQMSLLTPIQASLCILTLAGGKTYLIDASVDGNTYRSNGCSMTREWPTDKATQDTLLYTLRNPDCKCKVRVCDRPMAGKDTYTQCLFDDPIQTDECVSDKYATPERSNCSVTYNLCKRVEDVCSWKPSIPAKCPGSSAGRLLPSIFTSILILCLTYIMSKL